MKIKALKAFTIRDSESGALTSIAHGAVADLDSELATQLITDGLAEAYTLISPTGSVTITQNDTVDVTDKASAVVNVGVATVTYNVNGGTGSVAPVTVAKGSQVNLDDGTGLTAPASKEFAGWATASDATEADVSSPYTVTAEVTLYAVWVASV